MPTATPAQLYKKAAAFSATPGQLVLMLYDGALRFTRQAMEALDIEDFVRSQEVLNNNIIRAQAILTELQATLNFEKAEELSTLLYRLYDYMHSELSKANLERSKQPLENVLRFLGDIRDAWAQMLVQQGEATLPDRG
ncbi:MAG: flagellar export chaperone FliS [Chthoniobacterales bacterium]|nr:flagellar export chaperone FliS [Chthoniobacterales bacterium]